MTHLLMSLFCIFLLVRQSVNIAILSCIVSYSLAFKLNYTVSQKNVPPLACYNFDAHEWILIFLAEMLPIK